jgi:hypothetical protein
MNVSTLAARFDDCTQALREGQPTEALRMMEIINPADLAPAAFRLRAHLLSRAQRALTASNYDGNAKVLSSHSPTLLRSDQAAPLPGVSIVSACMNRQGNLLKVLPSWLESGADEIIIVDWSSADPVWPLLAHIDDPRLKVVRIDHEKKWILTHAFNIGLRLARHEVVFKLDADIRIEKDFFARNPVPPGTFVRGFWKSAVDAGQSDQKYINGSFGCRKSDLRAACYYDERIVTYGWDDSDLYGRLSHGLGLAGHLLDHESLHHLEQNDAQRLENQDVPKTLFLGSFAPTEHENLVNKFYSLVSGDWGPGHPAQDFALMTGKRQLLAGFRNSTVPSFVSERRRLSEMLAASQLARSSGELHAQLPWEALQSLEFGRLLRDAKSLGCDSQLVKAIRDKRNIHIFRCADQALHASICHTVGIVRRHNPALANAIFIIEDSVGSFAAGLSEAGHLRASAAFIALLEGAVLASPQSDIDLLERTLEAEGKCTSWTISFENLVSSALRKADEISNALHPYFEASSQPAPASAVVTSMYDERNLVRLLEYVACVVLNLRVVERVLLCYEAREGSFQMLIQRLCTRLDLPAQRLALLPLDKRPTFEALFALQALLPPKTRLAVCNADVAFDGTFHRLLETPGDDIVYAISRWDISGDGRSAQPIRIENGTPNNFSADAWIATTPFEPDFYLDYPIGTMHCDSFIYNQVGRSKRYKVVNPCLSVHVFHLHDSRFNSSFEKSVRDKKEIEARWGIEQIRNGGDSPIKGSPWCYLNNSLLTCEPSLLIDWRPLGLVLDLPQINAGALLWLQLLTEFIGERPFLAIIVRLPVAAGAGAAGRLLARYKQHFKLAALQFDIAGAPEMPDVVTTVKVHRSIQRSDELLKVLAEDGVESFVPYLHNLAQFPADPDIHQVRAELRIGADTAEQLKLIRAVSARLPHVLQKLKDFVEGLDPWTDERILLKPFEGDLFYSSVSPAIVSQRPKVSFITSLYRGNEHLPGYLENVAQAALEAQGEVVLVDANCDGSDSPALNEFFSTHPELRDLFQVIRLEADPGLYACWQLAIEHSRGEFITNANIDDRRSPTHTKRLIDLLESRPELAGACGSISAVTRNAEGGWFELLPNQVWFQNLGSHEFGFDDLFAFNDDKTVRSHNIMHCMPVWRRSLHKRFGYFDEAQYGTSADWAFWLRCAKGGESFHLDVQAFGRYYLNPVSHNRRHDANGEKERRIIADLIGVQQAQVIKQ